MTDRRALLSGVSTIVIKIGTSSIIRDGDGVSQEFMNSVARQVRELMDSGKKVLVVSSGAIGVGLKAMKARPKPKEVPIRQAAASVGQSILMQKWSDSFQKQGLTIAQILLTLDFYSDREKYLNLRNAIQTLLGYGVVPVINENDVICVKEIDAMFGDNDTLSAYVGSKMDADLLILLSDVEGLYDKNPKLHSDARLISTVESIDEAIESMAGESTSRVGVGGMKTKIDAARICAEAGLYMIIASSSEDDPILKAAMGENIGTIFIPKTKERKKQTWIKSARPAGILIVDTGGAAALKKGKSLLAVGIREVRGMFERGDVVAIECDGEIFAKGIPDYDSEEINKIKGLHSDRIESVLGHKSYDDVIRHENIALTR
ncbi:MAG: glutamate 5-kinase [Candidatus Thermoplasmatota archaeon]|nr:glutamate 5-kinase [Candidatus Methanomethylophilaceae archaeon]MDD3127926.1 glutamate 5-kinase [Candidatus Methanomethylophilaceae archaeon]MDI9378686.1 glutamate 5-kinase [Candidatus Thermoplasmatota archaeon]